MAWQIDYTHSQIGFSVRHMMISKVRGRFGTFEGTVDANEEVPTQSAVEVRIAADSIDTRDAKRDEHLRSPDFLNAAQYPYLTFKSTRLEKVDETHGRLIGNLTIREITKEVVLDVEYAGQARSPWGTVSAGFSAETKISRKDWDLVWNVALETGGMLVGDEISISIEIEMVKQPVAVETSETVAA